MHFPCSDSGSRNFRQLKALAANCFLSSLHFNRLFENSTSEERSLCASVNNGPHYHLGLVCATAGLSRLEQRRSKHKRKRRAQKKNREFALFLTLPHNTGSPAPELRAARHGEKAKILIKMYSVCAIPSRQSCIGVLSWQSCTGSPILTVLSWQSWLSFSGYPVLAVLSRLFCPGCPALTVLP